jgi:hypothetical protein
MPVNFSERRVTRDRRRSVLRALWRGNFARRRHSPRRGGERHAVVTDWFHPQWLVVCIAILLLCGADALLTLTLIARGAVEVNPFMAPLVQSSVELFACWKIGVTAVGVVLLTVLAKLKVMGQGVGTALYLVLGVYALLVGYELLLLRNIP